MRFPFLLTTYAPGRMARTPVPDKEKRMIVCFVALSCSKSLALPIKNGLWYLTKEP